MRERTIKLVGLLLVICMIAGLSTSAFAAKKSKKTKVSKSYSVKVPASIINGSDVTANRSFKVLNYKETTLAGIKLGDSNKRILQKYGNPTRVILHSEPVQTNQMNGMMGGMMGDVNTGMNMGTMGDTGMTGMTGMGGMNTGMGMTGMTGMGGMNTGMGMTGMTGMGGMNTGMGMTGMGGMNTGMGMTGMNGGMSTMPGATTSTMPGMTGTTTMPGMTGTSTMPGATTSTMGTTSTMPGMTGDSDGLMGMSGMPGMLGANGLGATTKATPDFMGTSSRISSNSIVWQYDLASGVQLEFIVKEGRVSQITVLSLYPWKLAQLKSGLMIGDTYKLVTYLWGIDYKQQKVGSFSRMTFWDKKGVALIFLNKKLVGMTVAAGDAII